MKITYQVQYRKCGKPTCHCQAGQLHGPYLYAYWRENGALKCAYRGKVKTTELSEEGEAAASGLPALPR